MDVVHISVFFCVFGIEKTWKKRFFFDILQKEEVAESMLLIFRIALFFEKNNGGVGLQQKLYCKMTLRLWKEEKAFGPGLLCLMQWIEKYGSMQKAASEMGLAYSKAWKMMKTAEKELGFALTERTSGGKNGGGSCITPKGHEMMQKYMAFLKEAQLQVDVLYQKYFENEVEQ